MYRTHKIISKFPIITVWYWLFCAFFLVDTNWYLENFRILDTLDSFFVMFFGFHYVFFREHYSHCAKIYLQCIYVIVVLNFCYFYLTENMYYFLYYFIIITYIIISLWKIRK